MNRGAESERRREKRKKEGKSGSVEKEGKNKKSRWEEVQKLVNIRTEEKSSHERKEIGERNSVCTEGVTVLAGLKG